MVVSRSVGIHDGTFHADEVTACSLLLLFDLIDRDKVIRTRDPKILEKCDYVCDVGGSYDPKTKRFDHHQADYEGHLSSAGMVWKYLHERQIIGQRLFDYFNHSLIWGVDAHDVGKSVIEVGVCTFSGVISNFIPPAYNVPAEEVEEAFFQALDFAHGHVRRLLERYHYIEACRQKVVDAMEKREKFLLFDEAMPWMDVFFDHGGESHPALFLVMPSGPHWKLRGIPPHSEDRMKVRQPLPLSWAGLVDSELAKASKIPGAIFCHKGRFISVWKTREDVLKALDYVLEQS